MNEKDIIVDHVWDCGAYVYITFHKNGEDPSDLIDPGICLDKVSKKRDSSNAKRSFVGLTKC